MRPTPLLLPLLLFSLPALAGDDATACPAGTHAEGAVPPAGYELRCVDADGRTEGVWRTWYESGQPMSERSMKQGLEHGLQRSWWPNGQLMMEGVSIDGSRVQGFRFWSITGQPSRLPPRQPAATATGTP